MRKCSTSLDNILDALIYWLNIGHSDLHPSLCNFLRTDFLNLFLVLHEAMVLPLPCLKLTSRAYWAWHFPLYGCLDLDEDWPRSFETFLNKKSDVFCFSRGQQGGGKIYRRDKRTGGRLGGHGLVREECRKGGRRGAMSLQVKAWSWSREGCSWASGSSAELRALLWFVIMWFSVGPQFGSLPHWGSF